jgi:putative oxidoreductase
LKIIQIRWIGLKIDEKFGGIVMHIVAIVLEILLGIAFLFSGLSKIAGAKLHVENFKKWGYPQWFRTVTGLVQLIGTAGLIAGIWYEGVGALAGIWLTITMLGAVITHARVKDSASAFTPPIILLILALAVTLTQTTALSNLFS